MIAGEKDKSGERCGFRTLYSYGYIGADDVGAGETDSKLLSIEQKEELLFKVYENIFGKENINGAFKKLLC